MMSSTNSESDVRPSFSSDGYDADELGHYRSLSSLAVVTFLLGLGSVVMFASPLLVVVPLATVAAALLAWKSIAGSEGGLTGAKLTSCGLALAILFSVAAMTRSKVRDYLLQQQADQVARQWLSLAADGRSEEMLELMTKEATQKLMPSPEESTGQILFLNEILTSAVIRQDPVVARMMALKQSGQLDYQIVEAGILPNEKPAQAALRYVVKNNAAQDSQACVLALKRYRNSRRNQTRVWLIDSWALE